jgi:lysophospholipase L1-like esterase
MPSPSPSLTRRQTLILGGASALSLSSAGLRRSFDVHDPLEWGVEGKGWTDTGRPYSRLPVRAKGLVRDRVWELAQQSAGLSVAFDTEATEFQVRVTLSSDSLAMVHMPATGVSGVDLYGRTSGGQWRWIKCGQPRAQTYTMGVKGLPPGRRAYRLYLPLYNGVEQLTIEVPAGAHFKGLAPRAKPSIVYYGTSIAQGACASRPGMALTTILGRKLRRPVINLGLSGNGKMEAEVAGLLAELSPAVFVIDCLPNMNAKLVSERAAPLVRTLRVARPETPIFLVEDRRNTNSPWFAGRAAHHDANHAALREQHRMLVEDEGVTGLHYIEDAPFLGGDGEASVDGSHPSDLGMMRWADVLAPRLAAVLPR